MNYYTRSILFIPGNNPYMIANADLLGSDGVVFDFEDAVPKSEKDAARHLVKNALISLSLKNIVTFVRINDLDTEYWQEDINCALMGKPDVLMVPKLEYPSQVKRLCAYITEKEDAYGMELGTTKVAAIVETAIGMEHAYDIATADSRLCSISVGGEDFATDLGATRTKGGMELFYSRSRIIVAARAAGIMPIDTITADIEDIEGLKSDTENAKNMGFDGKIAISPRQVPIINDVFTPSSEAIENAKRLIEAFEVAEKEGKGVFNFEGKMVDAPIVNRAKRVVSIASMNKGRV